MGGNLVYTNVDPHGVNGLHITARSAAATAGMLRMGVTENVRPTIRQGTNGDTSFRCKIVPASEPSEEKLVALLNWLLTIARDRPETAA